MSVNNNFYKTINDLVSSATSGAVGVTNYETFIDSGKVILDINGQDLQNNFITALMNKIGLVINTFRSYEGKYKELIRGTITNGNTIEMVMNHFYDTQAAAFVNLQDNTTVDQYVINKPKVDVRYFVDTNAYSIPITIQRDQLVKAFESPEAMDYFISTITGSVINSNEFAREKGRISIVAKMIAFDYANGKSNATDPNEPAQVYKLVTMFNNLYQPVDVLDNSNALSNEAFVKFAVETVKKVLRKIKSPSSQFNYEGITTFTPDYGTHLFVNSALVSAMATHIYTNNYNPEYSVLEDYIDVDYWQNANNPMTVTNTAGGGEDGVTTVNGCIAVICDQYAVGEYLKEQSMDTTPYNARGKYWNNWLNVETRYIHNTFANSVIFVLE